MNVFLDDLVNELVHQVQQNVVPTLERATQTATKQLLTPRPPASTDLIYISDRLLASSQPSPPAVAKYTDTGRDTKRRIVPRRTTDEAKTTGGDPTSSESKLSVDDGVPKDPASAIGGSETEVDQSGELCGDQHSVDKSRAASSGTTCVAASGSQDRSIKESIEKAGPNAEATETRQHSSAPTSDDIIQSTGTDGTMGISSSMQVDDEHDMVENPQEAASTSAIAQNHDDCGDSRENMAVDSSVADGEASNLVDTNALHTSTAAGGNKTNTFAEEEGSTGDKDLRERSAQTSSREVEPMDAIDETDSKDCREILVPNASDDITSGASKGESTPTAETEQETVDKSDSEIIDHDPMDETDSKDLDVFPQGTLDPTVSKKTGTVNPEDGVNPDKIAAPPATNQPTCHTDLNNHLTMSARNSDKLPEESSLRAVVPPGKTATTISEKDTSLTGSEEVSLEIKDGSCEARPNGTEDMGKLTGLSLEMLRVDKQLPQVDLGTKEGKTSSTLPQDRTSKLLENPLETALMDDLQIAGERASEPIAVDEDENDMGSAVEAPQAARGHIPQHVATSIDSKIRNSPGTMVTYIDRRHGKHNYLVFSLTDERPDDRTLLLFRRQIVQLGWWSPCPRRSETPSITKLLRICYAIHAYLQLDPSNVALVYCANGRTRTAVAMACYLKFAGLVQHAAEGFLHFLEKRGISDPKGTWRHLPPSLHLFFRQFDSTIEIGGFLNRKPLLLRAIALQGIPVEDKPCLDIWDSSQRHIYSSHPEMWDTGSLHISKTQVDKSPMSQWADEEGFYRVNVVLEGDFLILCRFGGDFAHETTIHDPSKILFRYTNTTGYLSGACPYELSPSKVDLSRRYAQHLDDDDFLVTLLFEADWERVNSDSPHEGKPLDRSEGACNIKVWQNHEREACEEGWQAIFQCHSARPEKMDIKDFKYFHQDRILGNCADHLLCLALQLANFDFCEAKRLLTQSEAFSWWRGQETPKSKCTPSKGDEQNASVDQKRDQPYSEDEQNTAIRDLFAVLDEVDVSSNLEPADLRHVSHYGGSRPNGVGSKNSLVGSIGNMRSRSSSRDPSLCTSGFMMHYMGFPRQGDIVGSFGPYYQQFHTSTETRKKRSLDVTAASFASETRPRIPFFPSNGPAVFPPPSKRLKQSLYQSEESHLPMPRFNAQHETAMELYLRMGHTGITLSDIEKLIETSQTWTDPPKLVEEVDDKEPDQGMEEDADPVLQPSDSKEASMNREAKEQQEKKWDEAREAEAKEKREKLKAEDEKKKEEEAKRREEEKNISSVDESSEQKAQDADLPLKEDPEYAKYFKMLKMGMSKEQVQHAMKRDAKDFSILDLNPNKSLKSQLPGEAEATTGEVPLKDDPDYKKYFQMLKMGLPMGPVKHALAKDGKDPSIMDLDPNKSFQSQTNNGDQAPPDGGVPLKEDPDYKKYFKMLKMGLPIGAVKNALTKDGKNPSIMDLDPNLSLASQRGGSHAAADDGPPLKEDPEYAKYFKMLTMGLPMGAVQNALVRDGKDPSVMDLDPSKSFKSQMPGTGDEAGPPLKEDPEYAKYFKMLSMGLPMGAVKNALSRDGKDQSIMDLDPNISLKLQLCGDVEERDTGVPLKDDPDYLKYFKMLSMGLPQGAVRNALERDGKDPSIMELDPSKSVAFQLKKSATGNKKPVKKKKRVRRKKIYWNPIDPGKLKEDSMWSIVRGSVAMDKLNYDEKEFDELFTESTDPSDKKKKKKGGEKAAKKLVQVIDGKRSMNGGIILARLKTDYSKIAEYVNKMEHGKFDSTQLKALKEYLADADERRGLITYMKKGENSKEMREKLYSDLSETEKYMVTMMDVPDAAKKFEVLLFRSTFKVRFGDITDAIRTLNTACDELRSSQKFRKLMAMILTVVNQINTGGEGKMAMGFTLDALLKLNEAKAFDKKTSVLHYVVKLVKKNDEGLVAFDTDLGSVLLAESVLLDGLSADVKGIGEELKGVHATVQVEADKLEEAGELKPMSLSDLAEQRTAVRHVGFIPQYNKIDHLTGRTSMERFAINAQVACEQANESIVNVQTKYAALLDYFGEDEQMATGDFFGTLRRFTVEWKKATEQVDAIEKKAAKEKRRAEAKAAKAAKRAGSGKNGAAKKATSREGGRGGIAARAASAANKARQKEGGTVAKEGAPAKKPFTSRSSMSIAASTNHHGSGSVSTTERLITREEDNGKSKLNESIELRLRKSWETSSNGRATEQTQPKRKTWETALASNSDRSSAGAANGAVSDPSSLSDPSSRLGASGKKSAFASKAAAYRRKKDKGKDEVGIGRSKHLSGGETVERNNHTGKVSADSGKEGNRRGEPIPQGAEEGSERYSDSTVPSHKPKGNFVDGNESKTQAIGLASKNFPVSDDLSRIEKQVAAGAGLNQSEPQVGIPSTSTGQAREIPVVVQWQNEATSEKHRFASDTESHAGPPEVRKDTQGGFSSDQQQLAREEVGSAKNISEDQFLAPPNMTDDQFNNPASSESPDDLKMTITPSSTNENTQNEGTKAHNHGSPLSEEGTPTNTHEPRVGMVPLSLEAQSQKLYDSPKSPFTTEIDSQSETTAYSVDVLQVTSLQVDAAGEVQSDGIQSLKNNHVDKLQHLKHNIASASPTNSGPSDREEPPPGGSDRVSDEPDRDPIANDAATPSEETVRDTGLSSSANPSIEINTEKASGRKDKNSGFDGSLRIASSISQIAETQPGNPIHDEQDVSTNIEDIADKQTGRSNGGDSILVFDTSSLQSDGPQHTDVVAGSVDVSDAVLDASTNFNEEVPDEQTTKGSRGENNLSIDTASKQVDGLQPTEPCEVTMTMAAGGTEEAPVVAIKLAEEGNAKICDRNSTEDPTMHSTEVSQSRLDHSTVAETPQSSNETEISSDGDEFSCSSDDFESDESEDSVTPVFETDPPQQQSEARSSLKRDSNSMDDLELLAFVLDQDEDVSNVESLRMTQVLDSTDPTVVTNHSAYNDTPVQVLDSDTADNATLKREEEGARKAASSSPGRVHRGVISFLSPTGGAGPGLSSFIDATRSRGGGPGLSNFLEATRPSKRHSEVLQQNFDDSSVAQIAENLQKQPIGSTMSDTWGEGDVISNWMGWANQAIRASDTDSVRGFENSRDLNDPNDFDDESTIASYYDDISFASVTPVSRVDSYMTFDVASNQTSKTPKFESLDKKPAITPAKVAASILFSENSPSSSLDLTPAKSNVTGVRPDQDLVDSRLSSFDVALDAGLAFGADDVGFDDGLGGFGGGGLAGFEIPSPPPKKDVKSPEKPRKWFPWG